MSEQNEKQQPVAEVEIEVTVSNHTHKGKLCSKGDKIKVSPQVAEMLEKAWAKQSSN